MANTSASAWLDRYVLEIGRTPAYPEYLRAFAANRGGCLSYRSAVDLIATIQAASTKILEPTNSSIDAASEPVAPAPLQLGPRCLSEPYASTVPPPVIALRRTVSETPGVLRLHANDRQLKQGLHPFTSVTLERLVSQASSGGEDGEAITIPSKYEGGLINFGLDIVDSEPDRAEVVCGICCEERANCVKAAGSLCIEAACDGWFCSTCLKEYYELTVDGARYAVPFMRCPGCRSFVRTALWQRHASEAVIAKWSANAADLLTLRCQECDDVGSMLPVEILAVSDRPEIAKNAFASLVDTDEARLLSAWHSFSCGQANAEVLLDTLVEAFRCEADNHGVLPGELETCFLPILSLIDDMGRRAVLQLAALRRWPKTRTRCCDEKHCFKCKVGTHHEGISCEEVQRRQIADINQDSESGSIQFCPGCTVATLKTEGCNHMICLCGEEWQWDGQEIWAQEWTGEEAE